jgi:hypothetical protein
MLNLKKFLASLGFILLLALGFLGYFLTAFLPQLFNSNFQVTIGYNHDLVHFHIWRFWWYHKILEGLCLIPHISWQNFILYGFIKPELFLHAGNLLHYAVFAIPLSLFFPFPLWWNMMFALIMIINGLAAYALLFYFTKNRVVSCLFSLILSFNPYAFKLMQEGRARELIFFCLLGFLLYFFKLYQEPRLKNALWCGLFLGLCGLFYWFYLFNAILFIGLWLLISPLFPPKNYKTWLPLLTLSLLLAIVLYSPYFWSYSQELQAGGERSLQMNQWGESFPLTDLPKSHYSETSGQLLHAATVMLGESVSFSWLFSWLSLLFLPAALILVPKRLMLNFILIAAFFYILALGPFIKTLNPTGEDAVNRYFGSYEPKNYIYYKNKLISNPVFLTGYKYFPLFTRQIRPDRYLLMAYIFLYLLSALGAAALFKKFPPYNRATGLLILLLLSNCYTMELTRQGYFPLEVLPLEVPKFYKELASQRMCGIIELPLPSARLTPLSAPEPQTISLSQKITRAANLQNLIPYIGPLDRYQFYQTIHQHKLYAGFLTNPDSFPAPLKALPNLAYLSSPDSKSNTFINYLAYLENPGLKYKPEDLKVLKQEKYKYVILHHFSRFDNCNDNSLYYVLKKRLDKCLGKPIMRNMEIQYSFGKGNFMPMYIYKIK